MEASAKEVLDFWFGSDPENFTENSTLWWKKDPKFDRVVAETFEGLLNKALRHELDSWKEESRSCLAFIILVDQFSRNIFRGSEKSFQNDKLALSACLKGMDDGLDVELHPIERWFFYMPLMHSESLTTQEKSLEKYKELSEIENIDSKYQSALAGAYDFAKQHYEIIKKFGRFPHRNTILSRTATPDEIEFLRKPGSSF